MISLFRSKKDKQRIQELSDELKRSQMLVEELKKTIEKLNGREDVIYTLHLDAEKKRKSLLLETERYIQELRKKAEDDITSRLEVFQKKEKQLVQLELDLRSKGTVLQAQLCQFLKAQLAEVEKMDLSTYSGLYPLVKEVEKVTDELAQDSATLIQFPQLSSTAKEEVPVYKFLEK